MMKEGFTRQRRNLISFSIALLFLEASKLRFEKINILGNEFQVGDPVAIYIGLWVALFYFLIRFYQYAHDLEERKLGRFFNDTLKRYAQIVAFKKVLKSKGVNRFAKTSEGYVKFRFERMSVFSMGKSWETKIDFFRSEQKKHGISTNLTEDFDVTINRNELILPRIKAFIKTCIYTTYFTEYILPPLIFLLPVFYKIKSFV